VTACDHQIDHRRPACACGNFRPRAYWHLFSNFSFVATMITLFEGQTMQDHGSAGLLSWRIYLLLLCFPGKNSAYMVLVVAFSNVGASVCLLFILRFTDMMMFDDGGHMDFGTLNLFDVYPLTTPLRHNNYS
jgi:hypothetical protein